MRVAYIPTAIASVVLLAIVWPLAPALGRWMLSDAYPSAPGAVARPSGSSRCACRPPSSGWSPRPPRAGLGNTKPYVLFERVVRPGLQLAGAVLVVLAFRTRRGRALAASYSIPYLLTAALMLPWLTQAAAPGRAQGRWRAGRDDPGRLDRLFVLQPPAGRHRHAPARPAAPRRAADRRAARPGRRRPVRRRHPLPGRRPAGGQALSMTVQHRFSGAARGRTATPTPTGSTR